MVCIDHCRRTENKRRVLKKNPLKNQRVMIRLNPYAKVMNKAAKDIERKRRDKRLGVVNEKRGVSINSDKLGKKRHKRKTSRTLTLSFGLSLKVFLFAIQPQLVDTY